MRMICNIIQYWIKVFEWAVAYPCIFLESCLWSIINFEGSTSQTHALFQKWESLVLTWTCERDFELRFLFRSKVCHCAISYMGLKVKNIRWAFSKEHPTSPAKIYMGWTLNEVGFRAPIHTHGVLQVCGGMWVEWIGWKTCVCVAGSSSSSPCKTNHVRYAAS
jgi:hypothetical protein